MKVLFWVCAASIVFTYAGYPLWLYFRARYWPRPVRRASIFPTVTILMAARNEEANLEDKLRCLDRLEYPANRLEIVAVSDGSTDGTNRILRTWEASGRKLKLIAGSVPAHRAILRGQHAGKAGALNLGLAKARGEIVVFTDARQLLASDSVRNLVADFADRSVGCVSGNLMIAEDSNAASLRGVGLYWRLEKKMRQWEARTGSSVGATGALYAARRDLVPFLPAETVLDDVYIPLQIIRHGYRVVFEPRAVATDAPTTRVRQEFRRKVRTLSGNYQLLRLTPWIVMRSNPVRVRFVCHKLLRLLMPFALVGIVIASAWLHTGIYRWALWTQVVFYGSSALAGRPRKLRIVARLSRISRAFLVLNSAAGMAFFYFITGTDAVWRQAPAKQPVRIDRQESGQQEPAAREKRAG